MVAHAIVTAISRDLRRTPNPSPIMSRGRPRELLCCRVSVQTRKTTKQTSASFGIMGPNYASPLKPLGPSQHYYIEWFLIGPLLCQETPVSRTSEVIFPAFAPACVDGGKWWQTLSLEQQSGKTCAKLSRFIYITG